MTAPADISMALFERHAGAAVELFAQLAEARYFIVGADAVDL